MKTNFRICGKSLCAEMSLVVFRKSKVRRILAGLVCAVSHELFRPGRIPLQGDEIANSLRESVLSVVLDVKKARLGLFFLRSVFLAEQTYCGRCRGSSSAAKPTFRSASALDFHRRIVRQPRVNERDITRSFMNAFLDAYRRENR